MTLPTMVESQLLDLLSEWVKRDRPRIDGLRSTTDSDLSCPSASGSHGDQVFATFDENIGELKFLSDLVEVPTVVKTSSLLNGFTVKNRLVGQCLTTSCHYWQGSCRLGHFVSKVAVPVKLSVTSCVIAEKCRWRKENGPEICRTCSFVRNLPIESFGVNEPETSEPHE